MDSHSLGVMRGGMHGDLTWACLLVCRLQALRSYLNGDTVKAEAAAAVQASRKADHEELAANVSFPRRLQVQGGALFYQLATAYLA